MYTVVYINCTLPARPNMARYKHFAGRELSRRAHETSGVNGNLIAFAREVDNDVELAHGMFEAKR